MHPLLATHLKLALAGAEPPADAGWQRLLELVSDDYYHAEAEREELRRAIDACERGHEAQAAQLNHELEQRTEFEQALADSRAELHEVLAAMPDQVWLVEADNSLVDPRPRIPTPEVNELMAALLESGELDAACRRARREGALVQWEFSATVAGQRGLYEARCVPHPSSRGVVLVRDLTELRATQQQLAASEQMASVGVMATGVAHEVNSPLTAVVSNLEHLAEQLERLTPTLREQGELDLLTATLEAKQGASRIREVVRELSWFAGSYRGQPRPCDVNELVDGALLLVAHELRHRAKLTQLRGELPEFIGDGARLAQAFVNLLMNAAQSIEVGQAEQHRIEVETAQHGEAITIRIADTGAGVAPRVALDPALSPTKLKGSAGLALGIARKIVEDHHGSLQLRAEPGAGSEVLVTLPLLPHLPRSVPSAPLEPSRAEVTAQPRLLIIDDEADVGRAMRRSLAGRYHITLARSGGEALELLQTQRFNLVICDLMMPEMSGMALFDHASRRYPEQAARFVFMTGGAFSDAGRRFLDQLTTEHLKKPFDQNHLREFVAQHLRRLGPLTNDAP